MCGVYLWLFEFFLTWPGMAVIVTVCVGNGVLCRARRAYSNAIGLMMLAVTFVPAGILWVAWGHSMERYEETTSLTRAIVVAIILFLLIWTPVAIRCLVEGRRQEEPMLDKPTGGFPVITTDDVDETQV